MEKAEEFKILLCNTDTQESAKLISHELVKAKLAACVNIFSGITSVYEWKDNIEEEQEITLIIKTAKKLIPEVEAKILELHSYDTPEILEISIESSTEKYHKWLKEVLLS